MSRIPTKRVTDRARVRVRVRVSNVKVKRKNLKNALFRNFCPMAMGNVLTRFGGPSSAF